MIEVPRHPEARVRLWMAMGLAVSVLAACATVPHPDLQTAGQPDHRAPTTDQAAAFERAADCRAADLLTSQEYSSAYHHVEDRVVNDGFTNHFVIRSDFGDFTATGIEMARIRINEVYAIARLREMKNREAYRRGTQHSVKSLVLSPFRRIRKMVKNPLYAVAAIPNDIFKVYNIADGVSRLIKEGFSKEQINEFVGFTSALHDLARYIGVDYGSTNLVLQQDLFDVARVYYAGAAPISIAQEFAPGVPLPTVTLGEGGASVGKGVDLLIDELGSKSTRNKLKSMGVPRKDRKALSASPWYSSRARRALVKALYAVKDAANRADYVQLALTANSEDQAYHFRRTAEMMAAYHDQTNPIRRLRVLRGRDDADPTRAPVSCYADNGHLVVFLFVDHLVWTEQVADLSDSLAAELRRDRAVRRIEIFVAGDISSRARKGLEDFGFQVYERAITNFGLEPEPFKAIPGELRGKSLRERVFPQRRKENQA